MTFMAHIHRPINEGDEDAPLLTDEQANQVSDLIRTALGSLVDPPELDADPSEWWFADFPAVVTLCQECGTVTIQILGNNVPTVHFSVEIAERLRDIAKVEDTETEFLTTIQRKPPTLPEGPPLYITRIAYLIHFTTEDPMWEVVAELVNIFDALFSIFVSTVTDGPAPE